MIHLLIDSTEFKRDPSFDKPDLSRIRSLGKYGLLKLHIPYIIYGECTSHTIHNLTTGVGKVLNEITSMPRRGLHEDDGEKIDEISNSISELKEMVGSSVKKSWDRYIDDSNSVLYPINSDATKDVFTAYFTAGPPFKSLKSRKDLPDAFIYYQALEIAKHDELIVITGDKNLRDRLNVDNNILAIENFEDFYDLEVYKEAASSLKLNESVEKKRNILVDKLDQIKESVIELISEMNDYELIDHDFSDESETIINLFEDVKVEIDKNEIEYYGDGFVLPLEIESHVSVEYYMYWGDYVTKDFKGPHFSESVNRHTVLVSESVKMTASKDYVIDLDDINEHEELEVKFEHFDDISLSDYEN